MWLCLINKVNTAKHQAKLYIVAILSTTTPMSLFNISLVNIKCIILKYCVTLKASYGYNNICFNTFLLIHVVILVNIQIDAIITAFGQVFCLVVSISMFYQIFFKFEAIIVLHCQFLISLFNNNMKNLYKAK